MIYGTGIVDAIGELQYKVELGYSTTTMQDYNIGFFEEKYCEAKLNYSASVQKWIFGHKQGG